MSGGLTAKYNPTYVLYKRQNENVPLMIMMCGLPGSGKSYYANKIRIFNGSQRKEDFLIPKIHSSDNLREEFYGDAAIQKDNGKIFNELHNRIKTDLRNGIDVVYDATNIKTKERIQFLKELRDIQCCPICIVMATPYKVCLHNNSNRERTVPPGVARRMYMNYCPPYYGEGFKYIEYVFNHNSEDYTIKNFFDTASTFDQENEHHKLTLGEHCIKCGDYIQTHYPDNFNLLIAALLHDNGKLSTKTHRNYKGIDDGNCHYYQHQNVGAYDVMFYLKNGGSFNEKDICYISTLIYYHMRPYIEWKQSEKCLKRDKELLGDWFYDVLKLHEADVQAH